MRRRAKRIDGEGRVPRRHVDDDHVEARLDHVAHQEPLQRQAKIGDRRAVIRPILQLVAQPSEQHLVFDAGDVEISVEIGAARVHHVGDDALAANNRSPAVFRSSKICTTPVSGGASEIAFRIVESEPWKSKSRNRTFRSEPRVDPK